MSITMTHPCQVDEHGYEVRLQVLRLDNFGELSQLSGGCPSHHRGVVLTQVSKLGAQFAYKAKTDKL